MDIQDYRRKTAKGFVYYQFDSLGQIVDLIDKTPKELHYTRSIESYTPEYSFTSFFGTKSMEESLDFAKHGWSYGVDKLNKKVKVKAQADQYKNIYDVAGGHVSVPRYLVGVPTNMIRKVPVQNKDRVITIVKTHSFLGSYSTDEMVENAVKFIQIVQNLESNGYRCNVDLIFGSSLNGVTPNKNNYHDYSVVRLRVKKANERLNLAKMAFPLANPSMFRRFVFRLREINKEYTHWSSPGACSSFYTGRYDIHDGDNKVAPFVSPNEYFVPNIIRNVEKFELKHLEVKC